ncbi:MAG: hypothetical protein Q7S63_02560 [bacterium]|nr:hypothetical protein [bacterium]
MGDPKPFHESVVDALQRARSTDVLLALCELIASTKIPRGHDEIRDALYKTEARLDFFSFDPAIYDEAVASLMRQKSQEAEHVSSPE